MRIGIDLYFSQSALAYRGIGNYLFDYLNHLGSYPDVELFWFQPGYGQMTSSRYEEALSWFIVDNGLDIFHLTSPAQIVYHDAFLSDRLPPVRLVATVYDTIPLVYPEVYLARPEDQAFYARFLKMLHRTERLLAISESARSDFIRAGFSPEKVVSVGTGSSECFYPLADERIEDDRLPNVPVGKPFVLGFDPDDFRKNAERLVEAFSRATRNVQEEYHLVFTGMASPTCQARLLRIIDQVGRPGSLHFTGTVTKSQLLRLLNRARALLFPSLYEGWGLPVLEAMQCGTPVLTSRVSSLPEVAGGAAVYVDPKDLTNIENGIRRILSDPGTRRMLAQQGLEQAKRFQWAKVAEKTVNEYRRIIDEVPIRRSGEWSSLVLHSKTPEPQEVAPSRQPLSNPYSEGYLPGAWQRAVGSQTFGINFSPYG